MTLQKNSGQRGGEGRPVPPSVGENLPTAGEDNPLVLDLVKRERFPAFTPMPITTPMLQRNGFGIIERAETSQWRWGLGPRSKVTFSLLRAQKAILKIRFNTPFEGQTVTVEHNGAVMGEFAKLSPGQEINEVIAFDACAGANSIRFKYTYWNGEPELFPNDPRAVAVIFQTLSLEGADGQTLSFPCEETTFPFVGSPLENDDLARKEYAEGKTVLSALPPIVTLALTTHCNVKVPCLICDINTRPESANAKINDEIIERARPLLNTARYVLLHCGGEAMLSKHFDPVIASIQPPTRVSFATNAMLLTEARTELMLERDIMGAFVVSLDAATAETFRVMRPSFDFERVKKNVSYYIKRAKELGRKESKIFLNMTVCERNLDDVPLLVDLAQELGASLVEYNHLNPGLSHIVSTVDGEEWNYIEQSKFKNPARHDELLEEAYWKAKEAGLDMVVNGKGFIGPDAAKLHNIIKDMQVTPFNVEGEEEWNSRHHAKFLAELPSCMKPWQETVIQPNGIIRLCYYHDESSINLGNLQDDDFFKMWNGAEIIQDREQFLAKGVAQKCHMSNPCSRCRPSDEQAPHFSVDKFEGST